jgi:hypothetical protein
MISLSSFMYPFEKVSIRPHGLIAPRASTESLSMYRRTALEGLKIINHVYSTRISSNVEEVT